MALCSFDMAARSASRCSCGAEKTKTSEVRAVPEACCHRPIKCSMWPVQCCEWQAIGRGAKGLLMPPTLDAARCGRAPRLPKFRCACEKHTGYQFHSATGQCQANFPDKSLMRQYLPCSSVLESKPPHAKIVPLTTRLLKLRCLPSCRL